MEKKLKVRPPLSKNYSLTGLDPIVDKLAPQAVEELRKSICESCENKTMNNFCNKNMEFIPKFIQMKISCCPEERWTETTRRQERGPF